MLIITVYKLVVRINKLCLTSRKYGGMDFRYISKACRHFRFGFNLCTLNRSSVERGFFLFVRRPWERRKDMRDGERC